MDPKENTRIIATKAIMVKEAIEALMANRDFRNLCLMVPDIQVRFEELHRQCCETLRSVGVDPDSPCLQYLN